jgi:Zn-dependent peptidase ImmA (M78 family)
VNEKPPLESAAEIEQISRNILLAANAWGKLPTPVEEIVHFADLQIEKGVDLSRIEPGFISKNFQFAKDAARKLLGVIDRRQKTIYLDHTQIPCRKNFVTLHEVGHDACSWQKALGYLDDEKTLDPSADEIFEREASFFASSTLFQLERFDEEVEKLPLSIKSAQVLGKMFGGSNHAAVRRYVERSKKRCALLVLHKPDTNGEYQVKIRNYFQSHSFTAEFGELSWPEGKCGLNYIFVHEVKRGRRLHEDGQIALVVGSGETVTFSYHFFNSGHNTFIILFPVGEKNSSRVRILPK